MSACWDMSDQKIITFCVSRIDDAKCIVVTRVCVSVRGSTPTLLHGPGCNLGRGRGCPLVVHYWADLQSGHGLRCYGNITRTLVISLRYDDIVRTAGWAGSARAAGRWLAGDRARSQNCAPYTGSGRGWLAGDWASTGGILKLLRQSGLRASTGGVLATKSERKMLASTCLYSLYAWLIYSNS